MKSYNCGKFSGNYGVSCCGIWKNAPRVVDVSKSFFADFVKRILGTRGTEMLLLGKIVTNTTNILGKQRVNSVNIKLGKCVSIKKEGSRIF